MEIQKKKCSFQDHLNIDAINYCKKCEIYMCHKCDSLHSKLFNNHQVIVIGKNDEEIFTGYCQEESHFDKLKFFCKTHNQLCCAACIAKIKTKEVGQHSECDICLIEEIKNEKKNNLQQNIKLLEELSDKFNESFNKLNVLFEKIAENKEKIKNKIQKIFTNIRNEINNREEVLLLEVNKEFENYFFKEDIVKNIEKFPNKIKLSLEKCKEINKEDNNNDQIILINECIKIENNIKDIITINEKIKSYDYLNSSEIRFSPEENDVINFLESIKKFGRIINKKNAFIDSSKIIKNNAKSEESIFNWIKEKINKEIITFKLIFRMTENGDKSEDFHKYCDNQGPTLVLVKTTKNRIFGGFTPLSWKKEKGYLYDENNQIFIFSLNLMKKYDMINKKEKGIY